MSNLGLAPPSTAWDFHRDVPVLEALESSVVEGALRLPPGMAECGRRRPHVTQDHFQEEGSFPEVLDSAVEVEGPPPPVSKEAAP